VLGDHRWLGTYGVVADVVAVTQCTIMCISVSEIKARAPCPSSFKPLLGLACCPDAMHVAPGTSPEATLHSSFHRNSCHPASHPCAHHHCDSRCPARTASSLPLSFSTRPHPTPHTQRLSLCLLHFFPPSESSLSFFLDLSRARSPSSSLRPSPCPSPCPSRPLSLSLVNDPFLPRMPMNTPADRDTQPDIQPPSHLHPPPPPPKIRRSLSSSSSSCRSAAASRRAPSTGTRTRRAPSHASTLAT
jgi:hypothetical protein